MLAQVRDELDIPGAPLLEERQLESDQAKCAVAFLRRSCRGRRRSRTRVPSFPAPQTTAAYKYPVNSPERELDRKHRAEYSIAYATLAVLLLHHYDLSLGF